MLQVLLYQCLPFLQPPLGFCPVAGWTPMGPALGSSHCQGIHRPCRTQQTRRWTQGKYFSASATAGCARPAGQWRMHLYLFEPNFKEKKKKNVQELLTHKSLNISMLVGIPSWTSARLSENSSVTVVECFVPKSFLSQGRWHTNSPAFSLDFPLTTLPRLPWHFSKKEGTKVACC